MSAAKVSSDVGEVDVHVGREHAVLDERALGHVRQRQVAQDTPLSLTIRRRRSTAPIDQAKVAKLCITPFGMPVVPEV